MKYGKLIKAVRNLAILSIVIVSTSYSDINTSKKDINYISFEQQIEEIKQSLNKSEKQIEDINHKLEDPKFLKKVRKKNKLK